jgi:hypothetical protein
MQVRALLHLGSKSFHAAPALFALVLVSLVTFAGCSDPDSSTSPTLTTIDEVIASGGTLPAQPTGYSVTDLETTRETLEENGTFYASNSQKKRVTNKYDQILALNSTYADALYPGAIIQGAGAQSGSLTLIGLPIKPLTLTIANGGSQLVESPSNATVTAARVSLIGKSAPLPAQMTYVFKEQHSTEQAATELGIDASWFLASMSGSFAQTRSTESNSMLLFFKQIYYTVSVPKPSFSVEVKASDLARYVQSGNPACYISSVSYGRVIVARVTAKATRAEMRSALEGGASIVNGKVTFNKSRFNSSYTFDAFVVGGSQAGAAQALASKSIDGLNALITQDAVVGPDKPGFPIEYTVRYLANGQPIPLGGSAEYTVPNWQIDESKYQKFDVYIGYVDVIRDGNTFTDGNFYYGMNVQDLDGRILLDGDGYECDVMADRFNATEVGSGGRLIINSRFTNVRVPKQAGKGIRLNFSLFDAFTSGSDLPAGVKSISYSHPWSSPLEGTYKLAQSNTSYDCDLYVKFVKK